MVSPASTRGRLGLTRNISYALDDMIAALRDEDPDVRVAAAEALGALGDPCASAPLLESLAEDPEDEVKVKAVEALDELRASASV